jgi:hypothetical protein
MNEQLDELCKAPIQIPLEGGGSLAIPFAQLLVIIGSELRDRKIFVLDFVQTREGVKPFHVQVHVHDVLLEQEPAKPSTELN